MFLDVLMNNGHWRKVGSLAMRARVRGADGNKFINMVRLGTLPGGGTIGGAAFLFLRNWRIGLLRCLGMPAALELGAVQSIQLGFDLLVFQLEFSAALAFQIKLLIELLNNIFVLALSSYDLLMAMPAHVGRQAFQVRAPLAEGALKIFI